MENENKNLCDRCKEEIKQEALTNMPGSGAGGVFGAIMTIGGLIFLVWCVVGFMRDCGMASCGRLM